MATPAAAEQEPVAPFGPALFDPQLRDCCGGCRRRSTNTDVTLTTCAKCGFRMCSDAACRAATNVEKYHATICDGLSYAKAGAAVADLLDEDGNAAPMILAAAARMQAVGLMPAVIKEHKTPEALRALVDKWRCKGVPTLKADALADLAKQVPGLRTYGEDLPELLMVALVYAHNNTGDVEVQMVLMLDFLYTVKHTLRRDPPKPPELADETKRDAVMLMYHCHLLFPTLEQARTKTPGYFNNWLHNSPLSLPTAVIGRELDVGEGLNVALLVSLVHMDAKETLHLYGKQREPRRHASTQMLVRLMHAPGDKEPHMRVFQGHGTLYPMGDWLDGQLVKKEELDLLRTPGAKAQLAAAAGRFHTPTTEGTSVDAHTAQRLCFLDPSPPFIGVTHGRAAILNFAAALETLAHPFLPLAERHQAYAHLTGVKWPLQHPLAPIHVVMMSMNFVA